MRAMRSDLTLRVRSLIGSFLDRLGEVCAGLAEWCFLLAGRCSPAPALSPEAAERIWAGVKARIEAEQFPPFQPTHADLICASLAEQGLVVRAIGEDGYCRARILSHPTGRS